MKGKEYGKTDITGQQVFSIRERKMFATRIRTRTLVSCSDFQMVTLSINVK